MYSEFTNEELKVSLISVSSMENMYENIIEKYRKEIQLLAEEAKGKSYKQQQTIQDKINILETHIYDCAHKLTIEKLKKELLETELYIDPENEF